MSAAKIWVWFCAYLNCAGWALSAIHQLNAGGYAGALAIWFVVLIIWRKKERGYILPCLRWRKICSRFRKPFPLAFAILAAMAFLGGTIYAPNNYDALAYRIPRVLHWLAAGQWHWVHTIFPRINTRSCGIEWVSAPFIALFKTDRFLFLISFISLLPLPGLIFSVFTRLGVRRRVAWHWMWIVPTGYSFLLQAGGIGNDLFGAPFALAAIDFALRAKDSGSSRDFFTSVVATAMMTSAKTSNLPLLLPWAIAILPSLRLLSRWPLKTLAVCAIAVLSSVAPTIFFNARFSNEWSGADLHRGTTGTDVFLRTAANSVFISLENFAPPVFFPARAVNEMISRSVPAGLSMRLREVMTGKQAAEFTVPEMQTEENSGLGFGVSTLLVISFVAAQRYRDRRHNDPSNWRRWIRWSSFIALLALTTQYGLTVFCRILTPYYALLIPVVLESSGQERLVSKRWWRAAAFAVFFIAAALLIVAPARPLFPIMTILSKTRTTPARIREVYSIYHSRNDAFAPVRQILPPELKVLGLITSDDPETSLWRPFGSRRVIHVCPEDKAADLKVGGIEYVLVKTEEFEFMFACSLDDWVKRMNAEVIRVIPLDLRASVGPRDWYLVKFRENSRPSQTASD